MNEVEKKIFQKDYSWEELADLERDVSEAVSTDFNPLMNDIPGEFKGTMTVTITYKEE